VKSLRNVSFFLLVGATVFGRISQVGATPVPGPKCEHTCLNTDVSPCFVPNNDGLSPYDSISDVIACQDYNTPVLCWCACGPDYDWRSVTPDDEDNCVSPR
jgi:hypothetical protein